MAINLTPLSAVSPVYMSFSHFFSLLEILLTQGIVGSSSYRVGHSFQSPKVSIRCLVGYLGQDLYLALLKMLQGCLEFQSTKISNVLLFCYLLAQLPSPKPAQVQGARGGLAWHDSSHSDTAAASLALNLLSRSRDIRKSTCGSRVGKNLHIGGKISLDSENRMILQKIF